MINLYTSIVGYKYLKGRLPSTYELSRYLEENPCKNKYFALINLITEHNKTISYLSAKQYFTQLFELYIQVTKESFDYAEKSRLILFLSIRSLINGVDAEAQIIKNDYN